MENAGWPVVKLLISTIPHTTFPRKIFYDKEQQSILDFFFFVGEYLIFLFKKNFFQNIKSELLTQHAGKLWEKEF